MFSSIMPIEELKSPLASKILEFYAATAKVDSIECRLHFTEDAVSLKREEVQSQGPQIREM